MQEQIFKAYDIRGVYKEQFNADDVRIIARAYLQEISQRANKNVDHLKVLIARDIRTSSDEIYSAFSKEMEKYGVQVFNAGLVPINALYYMTGKGRYDGGVMVTASHNPPEYGGLKLVDNQVRLLSGSEVIKEQLKDLMDFEKTKGSIKDVDIWPQYVEHVLGHVDLEKIAPMKIVIDAGNGIAGVTIPKIFSHVKNIEVVEMFFEGDGNFPNRPPNPLEPNASEKIAKKIKEENADLGAMFDADSDRVFLVDENGEMITGDLTILLLAKSLLKKKPGAGIGYNLISTHAVKELVSKWGGRPVRTKVGVMNISQAMKENDAEIASEVSSHFVFKSNYYMDASYCALLMALEAISEDGRRLSEIIEEFKLYYRAPEMNIEVENKEKTLQKIREYYKENILDELDGITVEYNDWWFNARASNTESLFRITVEAANKEAAEKHQQEILKIIKN